jgi:D-beta-D-heptose 7-phosphate kinase/D-beta-D-heptose 1-phosphate adenosyltransferase
VFTNGCFDLLHIGHITYLNEARGLGDALVVGLNTDRSVRALKGTGRPIIPEQERSHLLAALECVDYVILFDQDTPRELIAALKPDILVKGADYCREEVVGHEIVEEYGGQVALIDLVENVSTTDIINRIRNGR